MNGIQGSILLFDEEEWHSIYQFREVNVFFVWVFLDPFSSSSQFYVGDSRGIPYSPG